MYYICLLRRSDRKLFYARDVTKSLLGQIKLNLTSNINNATLFPTFFQAENIYFLLQHFSNYFNDYIISINKE